MNGNSDFLQSLDKQIAAHSEELSRLLTEKEKLERDISQTQKWLEHAKLLRQAEAQEAGLVEAVQPLMPTPHRFFGMTPRQAYRLVLRQKKRMTKHELVKAMKEGGFQFGSKAPLRVLQFAIVGDPHVKKIGKDTYEWQDFTEKDAKKLARLPLTS